MIETIGITVTYKDPITFHLRMIGIDEENQLRQKMFGATENEKLTSAYQNNVDLLADLSADPNDENARKKLHSNSEDVRAFFAEQSILKERIAEYAVRAYFMKLLPDVSFL